MFWNKSRNNVSAICKQSLACVCRRQEVTIKSSRLLRAAKRTLQILGIVRRPFISAVLAVRRDKARLAHKGASEGRPFKAGLPPTPQTPELWVVWHLQASIMPADPQKALPERKQRDIHHRYLFTQKIWPIPAHSLRKRSAFGKKGIFRFDLLVGILVHEEHVEVLLHPFRDKVGPDPHLRSLQWIIPGKKMRSVIKPLVHILNHMQRFPNAISAGIGHSWDQATWRAGHEVRVHVLLHFQWELLLRIPTWK
mmetsp:Transcript_13065/g.24692  ORF Transcript_13065/g.24692 Transcript_13065/m.24692 type:complete len:252 (-) Transcript_13065:164-919(-)